MFVSEASHPKCGVSFLKTKNEVTALLKNRKPGSIDLMLIISLLIGQNGRKR